MQLDLWIFWSCFFFIFTAKHHHSGKMPTSSTAGCACCTTSGSTRTQASCAGFQLRWKWIWGGLECWVLKIDSTQVIQNALLFDSLVGGHLTIEKGHLNIPKRGQRTARTLWFIYFLRYIYIYDMKDDNGLYYPTIHGVSLISYFKDSIQPGFHGMGCRNCYLMMW